jgi:hypothetical protein
MLPNSSPNNHSGGRCGRYQSKSKLCSFSRLNGWLKMKSAFGAHLFAVYSITFSRHYIIVESVFYACRGIGGSPESIGVSLVLGKQNLGVAIDGKQVTAQTVVACLDGIGRLEAQTRYRSSTGWLPAPGVTKPEVRQDMQEGCFSATVRCADSN